MLLFFLKAGGFVPLKFDGGGGAGRGVWGVPRVCVCGGCLHPPAQVSALDGAASRQTNPKHSKAKSILPPALEGILRSLPSQFWGTQVGENGIFSYFFFFWRVGAGGRKQRAPGAWRESVRAGLGGISSPGWNFSTRSPSSAHLCVSSPRRSVLISIYAKKYAGAELCCVEHL